VKKVPRAGCNNIEIYYEPFGEASGEPVLLLPGMASQLTAWSEGARILADKGFYAICPDYRDVGLSTWFDSAPLPDLAAIIGGDRSSLAYTLDDVATDMVALLDALAIPAAHICGVSMGASIGQIMAARHPRRVRSLVSAMSRSGAPGFKGPTPEAAAAVRAPMPLERERYIAYAMAMATALGAPADVPGYPADEGRLRALFSSWHERGLNPAGLARHMAAILAGGDRTSLLHSINQPTVVIHGAHDPNIPPEAGEAVAAAIPGARFVLVPGMGHDFDFVPLMPTIANALAENIRLLSAAPG